MSILSLLPVIGISWFFRKQNKILKNFDIIFSLSFITTLSYFFSLFDFLKISQNLIFFFGSFLFLIFIIKEKDKLILSRYLYFLIFCISLFFISKLCNLQLWDEFFWAQYTKSIYFEKKIYTAASIIQNHPRYTPGLPLYQNFFNFFSFKDQNLIFANLVLITSFIFIFLREKLFFSNINKFVFKNIFTTITVFTLFFIFSFGYLYVEFYLAMLFATIIIFIYVNNKNNIKLFPIITFLSFVLLIKETSIIFIFLLFVIALQILHKKEFLSFFISVFLTCIVIKLSWNHYVYIGGANPSGTNKLFENFFLFFETFDFMYKKYVNTFFSQILDYGTFTTFTRKLNLPDFSTFIWLTVSSILFFLSPKNEKINKRSLFLSLSIFFIFYYLFVFFVDFAFWKGEPVHFNRLSQSFVLITLFLNFFLFHDIEVKSKNIFRIYISFALILIFFINLNFFKINFIKFYNNKTKLINQIKILKNDAMKISKISGNKSKIYFIHQQSSGFERTVFNYYIHPNVVNSDSWSLGEPYKKIDLFWDDIWTTKYEQNSFTAKLLNDVPYRNKFRECCNKNIQKKYEFIFIKKKDEKLWGQINFLFKNKEDFNKFSFFKINYGKSQIFLEPIF